MLPSRLYISAGLAAVGTASVLLLWRGAERGAMQGTVRQPVRPHPETGASA